MEAQNRATPITPSYGKWRPTPVTARRRRRGVKVHDYDAIVVVGGAGGLSAALVLDDAVGEFLVCDDGHPRNEGCSRSANSAINGAKSQPPRRRNGDDCHPLNAQSDERGGGLSRMNKKQMLEDHLDKAHRYVSTGQTCIECQRGVIAGLEAGGRDTEIARALLTLFLEFQEQHESDRDRIARELSDL